MSFIALLAFGIGAGISIAFVIAFTSDVAEILAQPLVMLAMGWSTANVVRLVRRPKREPGDPSAPGDEPPVDTGYWREKYMREHPEVFGNWK